MDPILIIGLIFTFWFLVWAWPWWLLAFPVVFLILLAARPRFRTRVIDSFVREDVDRDTARFRGVFLGWLITVSGRGWEGSQASQVLLSPARPASLFLGSYNVVKFGIATFVLNGDDFEVC